LRSFLANRTRHPTPHPANALFSKHAYWKIGGCDEAFVGHYGNTDSHFRWRLAFTKGVEPFSVSQMAKWVHPLEMMEAVNVAEQSTSTTALNKTKKDRSANNVLKEQLINKTKPWSRDYLRFDWECPAIH
jgi:hypothetical protein